MSAAIELIDARVLPLGEEWEMEVALTIEEGECVALLGPTRSGKSLLLELCAGLVSPVAGTVRVCGRELSGLPEDERMDLRIKVGTVLQQPGLLSNMTVFNNVALPLRYHRGDVDEATIADEVMTHLTALGIDALRDRFPSQLNQGEIRCAAIARALVLGQQVLLLDDPTAGLDAEMTRRLAQYLATCRLAKPLTIVAALRGYSEFLEIADRVAFLQVGRVAALGRPSELLERAELDYRGYLFPNGKSPNLQSIKRGFQ